MSCLSQEKERQLRRLVTEIRMMEGTAQSLQQRMQFLATAISELRISKSSLSDLENVDSNNPLLVPIGGGAFVKAQLGDLSRVIVGIGAGISVDMKYETAVEEITERLEEMEKAQVSVEQQLGQILAQLESHQGMAERLSVELQGAI